jgi:hypothetical protein
LLVVSEERDCLQPSAAAGKLKPWGSDCGDQQQRLDTHIASIGKRKL